MTNFFANYIDLFVHSMCFICAFINCVQLVRRASLPLRKVPAYLVVLGATTVATFMGFGHLFEISYHAAERVVAGTFVYDFRFYSLILMGMVLLLLSLRMLRAIGNWFRGIKGSRPEILRMALLIMATSVPTVFFTPIGLAPVIACLITLSAMPFAIRPSAADLVGSKQHTHTESATA